MDAILWFVIIVLGAAIAINIVGADIHQFIYKNSRIKKCTGNARDNVRIAIATSPGIKYKPLEIEPLTEEKRKIIAVAIQPPYEHITLEATRKQLKSDPFETLQTGRSELRFISADMVRSDTKIGDSMYTGKEEQYMIETAYQRITDLEGQLTKMTANHRQEMEDAVRHASDLARSGKAPIQRR